MSNPEPAISATASFDESRYAEQPARRRADSESSEDGARSQSQDRVMAQIRHRASSSDEDSAPRQKPKGRSSLEANWRGQGRLGNKDNYFDTLDDYEELVRRLDFMLVFELYLVRDTWFGKGDNVWPAWEWKEGKIEIKDSANTLRVRIARPEEAKMEVYRISIANLNKYNPYEHSLEFEEGLFDKVRYIGSHSMYRPGMTLINNLLRGIKDEHMKPLTRTVVLSYMLQHKKNGNMDLTVNGLKFKMDTKLSRIIRQIQDRHYNSMKALLDAAFRLEWIHLMPRWLESEMAKRKVELMMAQILYTSTKLTLVGKAIVDSLSYLLNPNYFEDRFGTEVIVEEETDVHRELFAWLKTGTGKNARIAAMLDDDPFFITVVIEPEDNSPDMLTLTTVSEFLGNEVKNIKTEEDYNEMMAKIAGMFGVKDLHGHKEGIIRRVSNKDAVLHRLTMWRLRSRKVVQSSRFVSTLDMVQTQIETTCNEIDSRFTSSTFNSIKIDILAYMRRTVAKYRISNTMNETGLKKLEALVDMVSSMHETTSTALHRALTSWKGIVGEIFHSWLCDVEYAPEPEKKTAEEIVELLNLKSEEFKVDPFMRFPQGRRMKPDAYKVDLEAQTLHIYEFAWTTQVEAKKAKDEARWETFKEIMEWYGVRCYVKAEPIGTSTYKEWQTLCEKYKKPFPEWMKFCRANISVLFKAIQSWDPTSIAVSLKGINIGGLRAGMDHPNVDVCTMDPADIYRTKEYLWQQLERDHLSKISDEQKADLKDWSFMRGNYTLEKTNDTTTDEADFQTLVDFLDEESDEHPMPEMTDGSARQLIKAWTDAEEKLGTYEPATDSYCSLPCPNFKGNEPFTFGFREQISDALKTHLPIQTELNKISVFRVMDDKVKEAVQHYRQMVHQTRQIEALLRKSPVTIDKGKKFRLFDPKQMIFKRRIFMLCIEYQDTEGYHYANVEQHLGSLITIGDNEGVVSKCREAILKMTPIQLKGLLWLHVYAICNVLKTILTKPEGHQTKLVSHMKKLATEMPKFVSQRIANMITVVNPMGLLPPEDRVERLEQWEAERVAKLTHPQGAIFTPTKDEIKRLDGKLNEMTKKLGVKFTLDDLPETFMASELVRYLFHSWPDGIQKASLDFILRVVYTSMQYKGFWYSILAHCVGLAFLECVAKNQTDGQFFVVDLPLFGATLMIHMPKRGVNDDARATCVLELPAGMNGFMNMTGRKDDNETTTSHRFYMQMSLAQQWHANTWQTMSWLMLVIQQEGLFTDEKKMEDVMKTSWSLVTLFALKNSQSLNELFQNIRYISMAFMSTHVDIKGLGKKLAVPIRGTLDHKYKAMIQSFVLEWQQVWKRIKHQGLNYFKPGSTLVETFPSLFWPWHITNLLTMVLFMYLGHNYCKKASDKGHQIVKVFNKWMKSAMEFMELFTEENYQSITGLDYHLRGKPEELKTHWRKVIAMREKTTACSGIVINLGAKKLVEQLDAAEWRKHAVLNFGLSELSKSSSIIDKFVTHFDVNEYRATVKRKQLYKTTKILDHGATQSKVLKLIEQLEGPLEEEEKLVVKSASGRRFANVNTWKKEDIPVTTSFKRWHGANDALQATIGTIKSISKRVKDNRKKIQTLLTKFKQDEKLLRKTGRVSARRKPKKMRKKPERIPESRYVIDKPDSTDLEEEEEEEEEGVSGSKPTQTEDDYAKQGARPKTRSKPKLSPKQARKSHKRKKSSKTKPELPSKPESKSMPEILDPEKRGDGGGSKEKTSMPEVEDLGSDMEAELEGSTLSDHEHEDDESGSEAEDEGSDDEEEVDLPGEPVEVSVNVMEPLSTKEEEKLFRLRRKKVAGRFKLTQDEEDEYSYLEQKFCPALASRSSYIKFLETNPNTLNLLRLLKSHEFCKYSDLVDRVIRKIDLDELHQLIVLDMSLTEPDVDQRLSNMINDLENSTSVAYLFSQLRATIKRAQENPCQPLPKTVRELTIEYNDAVAKLDGNIIMFYIITACAMLMPKRKSVTTALDDIIREGGDIIDAIADPNETVIVSKLEALVKKFIVGKVTKIKGEIALDTVNTICIKYYYEVVLNMPEDEAWTMLVSSERFKNNDGVYDRLEHAVTAMQLNASFRSNVALVMYQVRMHRDDSAMRQMQKGTASWLSVPRSRRTKVIFKIIEEVMTRHQRNEGSTFSSCLQACAYEECVKSKRNVYGLTNKEQLGGPREIAIQDFQTKVCTYVLEETHKAINKRINGPGIFEGLTHPGAGAYLLEDASDYKMNKTADIDKEGKDVNKHICICSESLDNSQWGPGNCPFCQFMHGLRPMKNLLGDHFEFCELQTQRNATKLTEIPHAVMSVLMDPKFRLDLATPLLRYVYENYVKKGLMSIAQFNCMVQGIAHSQSSTVGAIYQIMATAISQAIAEKHDCTLYRRSVQGSDDIFSYMGIQYVGEETSPNKIKTHLDRVTNKIIKAVKDLGNLVGFKRSPKSVTGSFASEYNSMFMAGKTNCPVLYKFVSMQHQVFKFIDLLDAQAATYATMQQATYKGVPFTNNLWLWLSRTTMTHVWGKLLYVIPRRVHKFDVMGVLEEESEPQEGSLEELKEAIKDEEDGETKGKEEVEAPEVIQTSLGEMEHDAETGATSLLNGEPNLAEGDLEEIQAAFGTPLNLPVTTKLSVQAGEEMPKHLMERYTFKQEPCFSALKCPPALEPHACNIGLNRKFQDQLRFPMCAGGVIMPSVANLMYGNLAVTEMKQVQELIADRPEYHILLEWAENITDTDEVLEAMQKNKVESVFGFNMLCPLDDTLKEILQKRKKMQFALKSVLAEEGRTNKEKILFYLSDGLRPVNDEIEFRRLARIMNSKRLKFSLDGSSVAKILSGFFRNMNSAYIITGYGDQANMVGTRTTTFRRFIQDSLFKPPDDPEELEMRKAAFYGVLRKIRNPKQSVYDACLDLESRENIPVTTNDSHVFGRVTLTSSFTDNQFVNTPAAIIMTIACPDMLVPSQLPRKLDEEALYREADILSTVCNETVTKLKEFANRTPEEEKQQEEGYDYKKEINFLKLVCNSMYERKINIFIPGPRSLTSPESIINILETMNSVYGLKFRVFAPVVDTNVTPSDVSLGDIISLAAALFKFKHVRANYRLIMKDLYNRPGITGSGGTIRTILHNMMASHVRMSYNWYRRLLTLAYVVFGDDQARTKLMHVAKGIGVGSSPVRQFGFENFEYAKGKHRGVIIEDLKSKKNCILSSTNQFSFNKEMLYDFFISRLGISSAASGLPSAFFDNNTLDKSGKGLFYHTVQTYESMQDMPKVYIGTSDMSSLMPVDDKSDMDDVVTIYIVKDLVLTRPRFEVDQIEALDPIVNEVGCSVELLAMTRSEGTVASLTALSKVLDTIIQDSAACEASVVLRAAIQKLDWMKDKRSPKIVFGSIRWPTLITPLAAQMAINVLTSLRKKEEMLTILKYPKPSWKPAIVNAKIVKAILTYKMSQQGREREDASMTVARGFELMGSIKDADQRRDMLDRVRRTRNVYTEGFSEIVKGDLERIMKVNEKEMEDGVKFEDGQQVVKKVSQKEAIRELEFYVDRLRRNTTPMVYLNTIQALQMLMSEYTSIPLGAIADMLDVTRDVATTGHYETDSDLTAANWTTLLKRQCQILHSKIHITKGQLDFMIKHINTSGELFRMLSFVFEDGPNMFMMNLSQIQSLISEFIKKVERSQGLVNVFVNGKLQLPSRARQLDLPRGGSDASSLEGSAGEGSGDETASKRSGDQEPNKPNIGPDIPEEQEEEGAQPTDENPVADWGEEMDRRDAETEVDPYAGQEIPDFEFDLNITPIVPKEPVSDKVLTDSQPVLSGFNTVEDMITWELITDEVLHEWFKFLEEHRKMRNFYTLMAQLRNWAIMLDEDIANKSYTNSAKGIYELLVYEVLDNEIFLILIVDDKGYKDALNELTDELSAKFEHTKETRVSKNKRYGPTTTTITHTFDGSLNIDEWKVMCNFLRCIMSL